MPADDLPVEPDDLTDAPHDSAPKAEAIVEGIRRLASVLESELDVMRTFGVYGSGATVPIHRAIRGPSSPAPDIY